MIKSDESLGDYVKRRQKEVAVDPEKCFCGRVLKASIHTGGCVYRTCEPCGVLIVESVT